MRQVLILQSPELHLLSLPKTKQYFGLSNHFSGSLARIPCQDSVLPKDVAQELMTAPLDFALMPDKSFSDIKLIVSDMDSTLINIECIDEIAAQAGLKQQVAQITERAMQGELDFEQSLRARVALLKGVPQSALQQVYDQVLQLNTGAEYLLEQCRIHGVTFVLVSGGFTFFTDRLKQRLGFEHAFANVLEVDNQILTGKLVGRIIDAQAKADILHQFAQQLGCKKEQIIAIGDGANDIPMLQAAGLGVAYHGKIKAQEAADICINHNGLNALRDWFL